MKYSLFLSIFLISTTFTRVLAQNFPVFLQGTWKVENGEIYEHWDKISENNFRGLLYKMENGKILKFLAHDSCCRRFNYFNQRKDFEPVPNQEL